MKKLSSLILVGVLTLTIFTGTTAFAQEETENIAAVINGEEIMMQQIDEYINVNDVLMTVFQANQEFGQLIVQSEAGQELINEYRKMKFDEFLSYYLLQQEVEAQGIEMTEEDKDIFFQEHVDLILAQNNMTEEQMVSILQQQGMESMEEYKELFLEMNEQELLIYALQQETIGEIEISEEDMKEYYDNNLHRFEMESGIEVSHILLDSEEEAEEVIARLEAGEDFSELAQEVSVGPSAEAGGELGLVTEQTQFDPTFKEAAFALEEGEVSDVVSTEFGYHVIKVNEIRDAGVLEFEEVKEDIERILVERKREEVWSDYMDDLKEEAEVEMKI
ncbi:MAG: peptidyl-prolyl cis-trans isomerase [Bacillota bacterium]